MKSNKVGFRMRIIFTAFFLTQCLLFLGCDDPSSSQIEKHIFKRYGDLVTDWEVSIRGNSDMFVFSSLGDKGPSDFGCKEGDYVYFEAEEGYSNANKNGGTTYWCKLIFMRKEN